MPISPLTFGMCKNSLDPKVDDLWRKWQALANVEIRSSFGIDSKHMLGGPFNIKEGPLHEAIASKRCHRASSLSAHKWALRRICEARAKSRKCGAPGFVKALLLAKRYTQFAKLYDEGVLPNGIGIAIDLHLFWSGGGNCHPGFFDTWYEMLNEKVRMFEKSTRKEAYKLYRETLEQYVNKGTARAFRLLRPLVPPPSGKIKVGGK